MPRPARDPRSLGTSPAILVWSVALAVAVLWPGRVLSALDGIPLNTPAEAILIGVVLPALWWLDRSFLTRRAAQAAIAALLVLKIGGHMALAQEGLCARFSTPPPFNGTISTIDIDEPSGTLRSWDARGDWRASAPRCTAVLDRPYRSRTDFPSWFVNLLAALRPNGNVDLEIEGYLAVDAPGTFSVETGRDLIVDGRIGDQAFAPGQPVITSLAEGSHPIRLHAILGSEPWTLVPLWNGRDAWTAARFATSAPRPADALAAPVLSIVTPAIVLLLAGAWVISAFGHAALLPAMLWAAAAAALCLASALAGQFERLVALVLLGGAVIPVARRWQNVRGAFVLIGIPWLVLFATRSSPQIGTVTIYSLGDDWQMYQAAAYRIFMYGEWIRGGSPTFYFQPLYRWIPGALHVVFGDSSVGELYWDAACLLAAALTCFAIVKRVSGFRWAVGAAALTLATFTMSSIWYLIGRGLSEITALGWMAMATVLVMRARRGHMRDAAAAGVFAVLMFYTRLNHLLLAAFLLAWLLPTRTPAAWRDTLSAARRIPLRAMLVYSLVVAAGILLFATHTWWYAGHFSVVYGTSFGLQKTGLGPTTIVSPAVWSKIGEALAAQLSMREPAAFDPRALPVAAGAVLSLLALAQLPHFKRLPAALAIVTVGTIAGSLIAHTHEYPGRMTVHVVPFAIGMTISAASQWCRAWIGRRHPVVAGTPYAGTRRMRIST
jgi:hypothetical protein